MIKSGYLFKLGEGPINFEWNLRYFTLDSKIIIYILGVIILELNKLLIYYSNDTALQPRGSISLSDAIVSEVGKIRVN